MDITQEAKEFERIVGLIEKSIVPLARFSFNERLPNLKTGHLEECDVVIRQGAPPRETLTIVEVQKRGRKVEANTYRGWLTKLDDLGAQHLICVSAEGFPESTMADAKFYGNRVRLVTLAELEGNWPVKIQDNAWIYGDISYTLEHMKVDTGRTGNRRVGQGNAAVFKREGVDRLLTLTEIADEIVDSNPDLQMLSEGEHVVTPQYTPPPSAPLFVVDDEGARQVRTITPTLRVIVKKLTVPITVAEYVQTDFEGALAYAYVGKGEVGGGNVQAELIFLPAQDGLMKLVALSFKGLPNRRAIQVRLVITKDNSSTSVPHQEGAGAGSLE